MWERSNLRVLLETMELFVGSENAKLKGWPASLLEGNRERDAQENHSWSQSNLHTLASDTTPKMRPKFNCIKLWSNLCPRAL